MRKILLMILSLLLFGLFGCSGQTTQTEKDTDKKANEVINKIFIDDATDLKNTLVDAVDKMKIDESSISNSDYGILSVDEFSNNVDLFFNRFKQSDLKGEQLQIFKLCQSLKDDYMSFVQNYQLGIDGNEERLAQFNVYKIKLDSLLERK